MSKGSGRDKTIQDKLKHYLGLSRTPDFSQIKEDDIAHEEELLKEISKEHTLSHRLKIIRELTENILVKNLSQYTLECLSTSCEDLLASNQTQDVRHTIWKFYSCIVKARFAKPGPSGLGAYYFKLIVDHDYLEDLVPRLELLDALTQGGKSIENFEEEFGTFLLKIFPEVITSRKAQRLLHLLLTVIKYNAAHLNATTFTGLVSLTCSLCYKNNSYEETLLCMDVANSVLCYSHLPVEVVPIYLQAVCKCINNEKLASRSLKLVKNLMSTSLGAMAMRILGDILEDRNVKDYYIQRGAVFFLANTLWMGENKFEHLVPGVFTSILVLLDFASPFVTTEVVLLLKKCIQSNNTQNLDDITWELFLNIVEKILSHPEINTKTPNITFQTSVFILKTHDLISLLITSNSFLGSKDDLFGLIEDYYLGCPELSILNLLDYKEKRLTPMDDDWHLTVHSLLDKFFKNEERFKIRNRVLKIIFNFATTHPYLFENKLFDQAILQYFGSPELEPNIALRVSLVTFLSQFLHSRTCRFSEILEIFQKVLERPFHTMNKDSSSSEDILFSNNELDDVVLAVTELVNVFKKKIYITPTSHSVIIIKMLILHLVQHTDKDFISAMENSIVIRKKILSLFLDLRANRCSQLGLASSSKFSAYLMCAKSSENSLTARSPTSPHGSSLQNTQIDIETIFQTFVDCLDQELEWPVLKTLLDQFPNMLRNKMVVPKSAICSLVKKCTYVVSVKNYADLIKNSPPNFTKQELCKHVLPVLGTLVIHHNSMDSHHQKMLIMRLQSFVSLKSSAQAIQILGLCMLEMQSAMVKFLPSILLNMSKSSATPGIALPILEFLTTLLQLPHMFSNFVEDQYMSILAIILPYTNPFKFKDFITLLAHRLIVLWFLKCRIPFRKDFSKFITKGLVANMIKPFEENNNFKPVSNGVSSISDNCSPNKAFYVELLEVSLDLMARFTFGHSANQPKRCVLSEFLFEQGQSQSWIVDHKIVTVTTSECGLKSFKHGLCEKCSKTCGSSPEDSGDTTDEYFKDNRRRHKSAVQISSITPLQTLHRAQDDLQLKNSRKFERLGSLGERSDYTTNSSDAPDFLKKADSKPKTDGGLCNCWCVGWAEIFIHSPTGNSSWVMRFQNRMMLPSLGHEMNLPDISSLLLTQSCQTQNEQANLLDIQNYLVYEKELHPTSDVCSTLPSLDVQEENVSPLRRTNSSPEMKANFIQNGSPNKEETEVSPEPRRASDNDARSSIYNDAMSNRRKLTLDLIDNSAVVPVSRERGHTISVMSPVQTQKSVESTSQNDKYRSGLSPSYVFLQFYQKFDTSPNPLLIPKNDTIQRTLKMLDHTLPYETHKIGIVYIRPNQAVNEIAILSNEASSIRYTSFLQSIGTKVKLKDVDPRRTYLGGLDAKTDGKYALIWHDDVVQVIFHVATYIPNKASDLIYTNKKCHIANNYVCIVYNESGEPFDIQTIKSQVLFVCLDIHPLPLEENIVYIRIKEEMAEAMGNIEPINLSDKSLALLVRQIALQADHLCNHQISKRNKVDPLLSTWHLRLNKIKTLQAKILEAKEKSKDDEESDCGPMSSFTDYV